MAGSTTSSSALSAGTPVVAQWEFLGLGVHVLLVLLWGSHTHCVLEVLCSAQGGGVVSSQRIPLLHLGVQRSMCYLLLLGELDPCG